MAKGNFLLGYARGSVGDVTFSRVKGNQVAKARNRQPANPNTIPQAMQRALFADAVRFFTRGVQNAFKFAFEGKLETESDYNAFMRLNVNRGVRIGKSPESMYPAIGDWLVADGSITPPLRYPNGQNIAGDAMFGYYVVGDSNAVEYGEGVQLPSSALTLGYHNDAQVTSIGLLSKYLKAEFPQLRDGDFVTFLLISQAFTGQIGELFPSPSGVNEGLMEDPAWSFAQFTIDESSTAAISTIYHSPGTEFGVIDAGLLNGQALELSRTSVFLPEDGAMYGTIAAGAVIFSRQTSSGLLVSSAPLAQGKNYAAAIEGARTQAYNDFCMVNWGAADPAILQGYYTQA